MPTEDSTSRVALITGASQRLGAAIAETLHAQGLCVVLHYHQSDTAALALQAKFNALRTNSALIFRADLADEAARQALIAEIDQHWGRLDVLVNNAAVFFATPFGISTPTQWESTMTVNLEAPYFLSRAASSLLKRSHGCIVNLGDVYADRPRPDYAIYCISKAGMLGLTRALARELAPDVRVNAVSPGAILWSADATNQEQQAILSRTPLARTGDANDIATAVKYLVDASYVTGQVIAVDGGRSIFD